MQSAFLTLPFFYFSPGVLQKVVWKEIGHHKHLFSELTAKCKIIDAPIDI